MGALQLYIGASVDGYIADPDGGVGWLENFLVEGEDYGYGEFLSQVGAVVMGAATYEQELARGGWPYGERPTWVLTHRRLPRPQEGDVRFAQGGVQAVWAQIARATEQNVFLVGGADLARQFLAAGVLDELILAVVPIILGQGLRLFGPASVPAGAMLLSSRTFDSGVVSLRYRLAPAG